MRVFAARLAVVVALVGSIACGAKSPTAPPAPVYDLQTKTFTGNVKATGKVGFPFTVVNPGEIQVAITALAPVSTISMGIALGVWDPTASSCAEQLSAPSATLNVAYAANPPSPGEYCVTIFDIGNVVVSSDFTLTVTHY